MIWLLIGYMFLFIHRPFEVWPSLGALRLELIYMLGIGTVWLGAPKKLSMNVLHLAIFGFAGAVLLCSLASPWSDHCLDIIDPYLKFLVFYLMLVTVVHDEENLKRLLIGMLGFMALYMLHSLWEYGHGRYVFRMGIPRLIGVDQTRNDPNALATSILLSMVYVPVLWQSESSPRLRWCLAGYLALSFLCIGLTGSRGGFVGLIIWVAVTIWQSAWRKTLMVAAVAAAPVLFMALPESLQNRFETIVNPDVGPKNAQVSSEARIYGLMIGMELWQNNPLTGIGPGAWRPATGRKLESHNLYGQLMGEMGTVGVLAFGFVLLAYAINVWKIRSIYRQHPEWRHDLPFQMGRATALGVFLCLFAGNFGHNLFRYNWALFAALLSIAYSCVEQRLRDPGWSPAPAEWETAGEESLAWNGAWCGARGVV